MPKDREKLHMQIQQRAQTSEFKFRRTQEPNANIRHINFFKLNFPEKSNNCANNQKNNNDAITKSQTCECNIIETFRNPYNFIQVTNLDQNSVHII